MARGFNRSLVLVMFMFTFTLLFTITIVLFSGVDLLDPPINLLLCLRGIDVREDGHAVHETHGFHAKLIRWIPIPFFFFCRCRCRCYCCFLSALRPFPLLCLEFRTVSLVVLLLQLIAMPPNQQPACPISTYPLPLIRISPRIMPLRLRQLRLHLP